MLIVIGTGLAGYSLVREFRKLDRSTPVLMISADDGAAYSKPMLSTGFTKRKTADELVTANAGKMAEQLDVEIRTFTRVTRVLPASRQICIGEEMLSYTRLVMAVGAGVRHLPLAGDGADQVVTVNDLLDYRRLRARLLPGQTVAILEVRV
jgi:rubredoxin-NAD+ reductase